MHALERAKTYSRIGDTEKIEWKRMPWAGIFNKVLFCDPVQGTTIELAKIEKGATFPVHYHASMQTLFLLKGRLKTRDNIIHAGTFDVIPAGEKHGGYYAEEESIQYKYFSAIPVYFMEDGDVFYYKCDGTVEKNAPGKTLQNIMAHQ
jgi:quercetin dioxygenase-like cupin family protein